MPRARKAIIIAAGLILFSVAAITYVLPRIVIEINGGLFSYFLKDYSFDTINAPEKLGLNFKEFTTISRDNLKLKSILVLADSSNEKGTIIFLHVQTRPMRRGPLFFCMVSADTRNSSCLLQNY